jgi:hypothetical protein
MFRKRVSQRELYERHHGYELSLQDTFNTVFPKGNNPKSRVKLIGSASLQQYLTAVDIVHSKITSVYDVAPNQMAVQRPSYEEIVTATPVRRLDIMNHSLVTGQGLITEFGQKRGDLGNLLERLANLSAFGITLSHIYENANGTAARAVAHLIRYGSSPEYTQAAMRTGRELAVLMAFDPWDYAGLKRYEPMGEWRNRADENPEAFLDHIAAFDVPFDSVTYEKAIESTVQTPYPVPQQAELRPRLLKF